MDFDLKFWAGTEESLAMYMALMRAVLMGEIDPSVMASRRAEYADAADQPERMSRLLTKAGDLAIIKVAGPLNNTDSWMNEWRGMTGYPEIRQALVQAATDPEVQGVILDINSGGGAVSGVFDTAKLIQQVDKIKPVHSFSDGQMASAAYLLGSSARTVNVGRMTEAGSVGVLTVHQEMSKMMKELGVTPTVLRAGKYKAMGNPYEPLSEAAQAEIQGQLDYMYRVFVEHVADRRKVSYDVADKQMAQGRVFIGDKALEVGLVDAVTTFDDVATKLQRGIDSKKPGSKYAPSYTQGKTVVAEKKPLTEQEVAALALGAGAAGANDAGTQANENEQHGGGSGDAAAQADAKPGDKEGAGLAAGAEAAAANGGGSSAAPDKGNEIVAFLRTELSAEREKVTGLTVELRDERAKLTAMEATHKEMRAIAEMSVNHLRVALGSSGAKVEEMTDAALLAEQKGLRESFEKKFRAGGVAVASTNATEKKGGEQAGVDPVRRARISATRPR